MPASSTKNRRRYALTLCTQRSLIILTERATDITYWMWIRLVSLLLLSAALLAGADIRGTITIGRKLTRHNVTAPAGMYQRGVSVELGADAEGDPLAFERSHGAVYLQGGLSSPAAGLLNASPALPHRPFLPPLSVILPLPPLF